MLESIYKISNQKSEFTNWKNKKLIELQFSSQETKYQNRVIELLEKKTLLISGIAINRVLGRIILKYKRETFQLLRKSGEKCEDELPQSSMDNITKIKSLILITNQIKHKRERKLKLDSFKTLSRNSQRIQKCKQFCNRIEIHLFRFGFDGLKQHVRNHHNCNLSYLDISLIHAKKQKQIESTYEIGDKNFYDMREREQIENLKQKIQRKQKEIKQYEQMQSKQIEELRSKIKQMSKSRISHINVIEEQNRNQTNFQEILLSKFIRKNFFLEEKLESAQELLASIRPDLTTQFGRKLSEIIKKNKRNYELEEVSI